MAIPTMTEAQYKSSEKAWSSWLKNNTPTQREIDEEEKRRKLDELTKEFNKQNKGKDGDGKRGFFSKAFDTVNLLDGGRSWTTEKPSDEQAKKGALTQGKDIVSTLFSGTEKVLDSADALTGAAERNSTRLDEAYNKANQSINQLLEKNPEDKKLLEAKSKIRKAYQDELQKNLKDTEWAGTKDEGLGNRTKKAAGVALETASEVVPMGRGVNALLSSGKLASRVAKGAAEGAISGGVGDFGAQLADEQDGVDFGRVAESAGVGALLGGGIPAAGGLIKRGGKSADNAVNDVETTTPKDPATRTQELLDETKAATMAKREGEFRQIMGERDFANSNTISDPTKQLPERAGEVSRTLDEIDADIQRLQTEGDVNASPEASRAKFKDLQAEREIAAANEAERGFTMRSEERQAFADNGLPNDPVEAQKAIDDFDANPPENALLPDQKIEGAFDVFTNKNMPLEIKEAATELLDDRGVIEVQMRNLMTKDKADKAHLQMDDAYKQRQAEIAEMPEPRQLIEQQKLDEKYMADLEDLDKSVSTDADQVAQYEQILAHLDDKEQQLVAHSNMLMEDNPDLFKSPDDAEIKAQREPLTKNLEDANRFGTSRAIVEEASDSPNPQVLVDRDPDVQAAYKASIDENVSKLNFKNIGNVRESIMGIMSPSKNLEKMGLRPLHTNIIKAESLVNQNNKADVKVISEIARAMKKGDALGEQIIDYLQGTRKTLSATDEETAGMIRSFLDEKADILKERGHGTLENYFPQLFDMKDPATVRLFKNNASGEINFGNLKKRVGNDGNYNKDVVEVLMQYSRGFNRKMYLEPALKPLDDIRTRQDITQAEADWIGDYTKQLMGMSDPGTIEKAFNATVNKALGLTDRTKELVGSNHYRKTLATQRMISAVATMGFNPGTAIRNMTQIVNTVAGIGPKHALIGLKRGTEALRKGPGSDEWKEMTDSGVFDAGISKHYSADLDAVGKGTSKVGNAASKGAEFAMSMIRGTDVYLRAQTYYGAKALGEAKGLQGEALKDFAIKKVVDTQFITSAVDMPTKFNGPGIRSLTQLATFSAKQAGFLSQMGIDLVKKSDDAYAFSRPEQAANLLAAGLTAWGATEALKPLMGFNEKEWIPFGQQAIEGSLYRSPLVTLIAGNGKGKMGLLEAVKTGDMGGFLEDNWSQLAPAGTQAKKTYEGIKTTQSGISKNPEGKVRYLQDMGGWDQIKGSIFGQYSTKAGQRWIQKGFPTLTDSEMRLGEKEGSGEVTFEQLPRDKQEQFYKFYESAKQVTGTNKAKDAIKEAAMSGDENRAVRLADEHNASVKEAMDQYFSEYQDLPEQLQDRLFNELLIDVQKQIDNAIGK